MLLAETIVQLFTIMYASLALIGASLVTYIGYKSWKKMDNTLVRARVFLDESFLEDNWTLLSLACLFFLIHVTMELSETFGLSMEENTSELIRGVTGMGVLLCIVISAYKWLKLLNPDEQTEQSAGQESLPMKETAKNL